jgi:hypothetical protein
MNFPDGTIIQNYNVNAGRVIQLPCFMDQPEPPDGFRAVVFATPTIAVGGPYINQTGPDFDSSLPGAIQFDLTQLMQQNALSRARSIMIQSTAAMGAATTGFGGNPITLDLVFDSGLYIPVAPPPCYSEAVVCADFISANPIFALLASSEFMGVISFADFTVTVANFNLRLGSYSSGSTNNPA